MGLTMIDSTVAMWTNNYCDDKQRHHPPFGYTQSPLPQICDAKFMDMITKFATSKRNYDCKIPRKQKTHLAIQGGCFSKNFEAQKIRAGSQWSCSHHWLPVGDLLCHYAWHQNVSRRMWAKAPKGQYLGITGVYAIVTTRILNHF